MVKCGRSAERRWDDSANAIPRRTSRITSAQERKRSSLASTFDNACHDKYRAVMDPCCHRRCGARWSLLCVTAARRCFRYLFPDHALNHSLVAAHLKRAHQHRLCTPARQRPMKRIITGFDKDDENHWRAVLDCGHRQHVRHDPPLTTRNWVLTEDGRASRLGFELNCKH